MNIRNALKESGLPSLEAEVLLSKVLGTDRTMLLTHGDTMLRNEDEALFTFFTDRRKKNEPISYIVGYKEFYGRQFDVNSDVLIPRPATEGLVDTVLQFFQEGEGGCTEIDTDISALVLPFEGRGEPKLLADIGTGSGCIATTLALHTPYEILATDISDGALFVAKKNAINHGVSHKISFTKGSMLGPLVNMSTYFFVVTNPPYIPTTESLMPDVADYEPHGALFAGQDGMSVLLPLFLEAKSHPFCSGIALECRNFQAEELLKIL
ncbi:peptide chain release factor N(5)-glutamine methyltransferase [Candidatus Peregrinibacteria bacterium CG10_big_fil_rev_8_21_14_0_10_49_24]|nr:MAG: protein-(glutamine-N5) methyltransferase, release factor-specific [Candidatus Peregrinibacteria bacterium CG11_big_fil_rev_8_21_14_0_20_49_14]PIR50962.1 MAG: peptide chain release factor N(5)-glutamine methyltransferase [Candidatus Peregrinibacteria bacterium CG10_big_fil_rev_8_21_14_0_10_49_24]PJA67515.1 MAG: peptide chain release factor N(5)-glutamine methyltransferase [Candidatus Peregrinibacteria bacterium CG_4_9_14_3_um_filter_49_12]